MDVALMTEGTYPHSAGGVSVWCDQLVRGMAEHDFQVVALVGSGAEVPAWELPRNVSAVHAIPLWGARPTGRRLPRKARNQFEGLFRSFVECLHEEAEQAVVEGFGEVLRRLFFFAQRYDLVAALGSRAAVQILSEALAARGQATRGRLPTASLLDVMGVLQLIEHALRPLSAAPVVSSVSHCVANGLATLPALAAKWVYGTPILLTEHGVYLRESYLSFQRQQISWPVKAVYLAFLRRVCELGYRQAAVVAPGNAYNQRWEEQLGAHATKIRTVYNGVDPADFPAQGVEPEVPTVSWAGRIDPIKDLETLIRSFAMVRADIPDARLRLFGGVSRDCEAYLEQCRALVAGLGLTDAVTFEGRVPDIKDAYAAGHVVVLSSISEGFPYTVIEAMTSGRACVVTDVGGVAEAIGDTGLLVEAQNAEMMAQACRTLLSDPDLRRRLGTAARQRALDYFTVDRATGVFGEFYTSLSAGRPLSLPSAVVPTARPQLVARVRELAG